MATGDPRTNYGLYAWHKNTWAKAGVGVVNPNVGTIASSAVTRTTARVSSQIANYGARVRMVYGRQGTTAFESRTAEQSNVTPGTTYLFQLLDLVPATQYWCYAAVQLLGNSPNGGSRTGECICGEVATFTTAA